MIADVKESLLLVSEAPFDEECVLFQIVPQLFDTELCVGGLIPL